MIADWCDARRKCICIERPACGPIDADAHVDQVRRKTDEVVPGKLGRELLLQLFSISCPYAKRDERADVSEDSFFDSVIQLLDVLVSKCQIQTVFSCFRQDLDEGWRGEILKLVAVEVKIFPVFSLTWIS